MILASSTVRRTLSGPRRSSNPLISCPVASSLFSYSADLGSAYAPLVLLSVFSPTSPPIAQSQNNHKLTRICLFSLSSTPVRGIMTNKSLPLPHVGSSRTRISAGREASIALGSILGGALLAAGLLVMFRCRRHHRESQRHLQHILGRPGVVGTGNAVELDSVQSQTTLRPVPEAGWKRAEGDASSVG